MDEEHKKDIDDRLSRIGHRVFLWSLGIIGAGIMPLIAAVLRGYVNQQVLIKDHESIHAEIAGLKSRMTQLTQEAYEARVDFYRFYYEQTGGHAPQSQTKFGTKPEARSGNGSRH